MAGSGAICAGGVVEVGGALTCEDVGGSFLPNFALMRLFKDIMVGKSGKQLFRAVQTEERAVHL